MTTTVNSDMEKEIFRHSLPTKEGAPCIYLGSFTKVIYRVQHGLYVVPEKSHHGF